jgi:hypothetical protein
MNEQGIAWMIAGGSRTDTTDQRNYEHLLALRAAQRATKGDRVGRLTGLRSSVAEFLDRAAGTARPQTATDCCVA